MRITTAGGRFEATHPRFPLVGKTSYLTGQRAEQLAAVAGALKRLYFMRERILELGPVGEAYLTELIHARPFTWKGDVERLFALLEELGEAPFLRLLQRADFQRLWGAEYVLGLRGSGGGPVTDLDATLKRLHLATVRRLWGELALRAESEGMSYRDFLQILVAEEIAHRAQTRIMRSVRKARFPFLRTIEEFDFTFQTSLRLQMLGSYLGPELVAEGRNLVLSGPTGTGKTHAARLGTIDHALEPYVHPQVLVVDELGYLSHVEDAVNVLYRVVNDRYLRSRPILITTNKPLAALGRVLHDGDLAEAILDRVLERGAHFQMRGRSYRTRHLKDPSPPPTQRGLSCLIDAPRGDRV